MNITFKKINLCTMEDENLKREHMWEVATQRAGFTKLLRFISW